jgi:hypothetical protein
MTSPKSVSRRKLFFRLWAFLMTFASLCLLLAAFSPQPAVEASGLLRPTPLPSATAGPSPTPEPPNYCGNFRVWVEFRGIGEVNGKIKPIIIVHFRDDRDTDCDGIPDGWDNCPLVANHDQLKTNDAVSYGDACHPESGYRLTSIASEIVIYRMSDGWFQFYSPQGEQLGLLSKSGLVAINPTLVVRQIVGRTYLIGYTDAAGRFRSTQFQSNALTFSVLDIGQVVVSPPTTEVKVGQSVQLFATGLHPSGIELWFIPRWSATGGTVTREGVYTAGTKPGTYTVTACRISNVCGSATVTIVQ